MTEPDDETQRHQVGTTGSAADADPDPAIDATPLPPSVVPPPNPPGPAIPPPPPPAPPLTAAPDRPADPGWREPPWIPPADRVRERGLRGASRRDRPASPWAFIVGLVLIVLGGWWFLERTLGIDLPRIAWGSLWPILLILLGGAILIRSIDRRP